MTNKEKLLELDKKMKHARSVNAHFHPTNPPCAWFCIDCGVFGKDGEECWSCDGTDLCWQYIPRFGGGVQTTGPFESDII